MKQEVSGCSQIMSAKNGGVQPPPTFVSQCQHCQQGVIRIGLVNRPRVGGVQLMDHTQMET